MFGILILILFTFVTGAIILRINYEKANIPKKNPIVKTIKADVIFPNDVFIYPENQDVSLQEYFGMKTTGIRIIKSDKSPYTNLKLENKYVITNDENEASISLTEKLNIKLVKLDDETYYVITEDDKFLFYVPKFGSFLFLELDKINDSELYNSKKFEIRNEPK